MGERKVLNKYYPPDFDPTFLPRNKRPKNEAITVRMMLPMNVQCTSCGEFLYAGKKFNSKKECAIGEDYLGILVWRFYIKCTMCSSEITFKTDPKRGNYTCEHGCRRNFEPWREEDDEIASAAKKKEEEEKDTMKALENRTEYSKKAMEEIEQLEDLKEQSARLAKVDPKLLLQNRLNEQRELAACAVREDEAATEAIFGTKNSGCKKRIHLDDSNITTFNKTKLFSTKSLSSSTTKRVLVKRKRACSDSGSHRPETEPLAKIKAQSKNLASPKPVVGTNLIMNAYASSGSSSDSS